MFSLDRKSTDIIVSEEAQTNENDASITQLLLRLCKLRMVLCRRTPAQVLQFLSNFVVTELIEESEFDSYHLNSFCTDDPIGSDR